MLVFLGSTELELPQKAADREAKNTAQSELALGCLLHLSETRPGTGLADKPADHGSAESCLMRPFRGPQGAHKALKGALTAS